MRILSHTFKNDDKNYTFDIQEDESNLSFLGIELNGFDLESTSVIISYLGNGITPLRTSTIEFKGLKKGAILKPNSIRFPNGTQRVRIGVAFADLLLGQTMILSWEIE